MQTLLDSGERDRILERILRVSPDSRALWGKMSAHQMICHLNDSYLVASGDRTPSFASGLLQRTVIKFVALRVPLRWPQGVPTLPEVDQFISGTKPVDFIRDREELFKTVQRFCRKERDFEWAIHPIFAAMSEWEWMRWGYLHADHHLRQFGV
jgi:Protein of unknown function (DUF1569)